MRHPFATSRAIDEKDRALSAAHDWQIRHPQREVADLASLHRHGEYLTGAAFECFGHFEEKVRVDELIAGRICAVPRRDVHDSGYDDLAGFFRANADVWRSALSGHHCGKQKTEKCC